MSQDNKKVAAIVGAIIAVVLAAFVIYRTVTSGQPQNAGPLGGGSASTSGPPGKPGAENPLNDLPKKNDTQ